MTGNSGTQLMELTALLLLEGAHEPVGSARLAEAFRQSGIPVASATAGRYLRQLDERGLTRPKGTKLGRIITDAGRQRLRQLSLRQRQDEHGARCSGRSTPPRSTNWSTSSMCGARSRPRPHVGLASWSADRELDAEYRRGDGGCAPHE